LLESNPLSPKSDPPNSKLPYPVLANPQLIGGALTVMVVSFSACFWAIAAFRPERDAAMIQLLTDTGWLSLLDVSATATNSPPR
jgi:hypothetical protein